MIRHLDLFNSVRRKKLIPTLQHKLGQVRRSLHLSNIDQSEKIQHKITKQEMEFTYISPGSIKIGSPENETGREQYESQHMVTLTQGFYMQKTPVTQTQWKTVMGRNPSSHKGDGDRPVEQVSWYDVQDFIKRLNDREGRTIFSFPTEAQWEYACRAGTQTKYYTGNTQADLDWAGWYKENSNGTTHPVAQKVSNGFGLYDMHGNVFEWVEDHWHDSYQDAPVDGSAWIDNPGSSYRIIRGGCWAFPARDCRAAFRGGFMIGNRSSFVGFRIVLLPGQLG